VNDVEDGKIETKSGHSGEEDDEQGPKQGFLGLKPRGNASPFKQ